jgi:hypothetical protein
MDATAEHVEAGHAVSTWRSLTMYDPVILGFLSRAAWKCPASRVLEHYDRHVTANHLDVGVGTGYFLDHCRFPDERPRLGLMDVNEPCLETTTCRVSRYRPEVYRANVLAPITFGARPFESLALNYLLHCLPGTLETKGAVFENLAPLVNPGGVVFGATLLHGGVHRNRLARHVMKWCNARGIFSNAGDDVDGLQLVLGTHLVDAVIEVVGCVALFSGRVRATDAGPAR